MANPSTAHEPSMEEILASIRQIISEDGDAPPPGRADDEFDDPEPRATDDDEEPKPPRAAAAEDSAAEAQPIPERTPESTMKTPTPTATTPNFGAPAARTPDIPAAAPVARPAPVQHTSGNGDNSHLLSQQSDAAVSGAFSALAHTILAQNARTLEDLVAEMLRPMLKEWLDDNLPHLVERLVREEIERVSRGRR